MSLRLDAICAKLKLSKASTESGNSAFVNNNDSESPVVSSQESQEMEAEDSDEKQSTAAAAAAADDLCRHHPVSSASSSSAVLSLGNTASSVALIPSSTSSSTSSSSSSFSSSSSCALTVVSRRSRRKNFQPRCIQEVIVKETGEEEKAKMTLADDNRSDSVGDDISHDDISHDDISHDDAGGIRSGADHGVLDLRVSDPNHQVRCLNGKRSDEGLSSVVDSCGVIDLSLSRRADDDSFPAESSSAANGTGAPGKSRLKSPERNLTSKSASDIPSSLDDNGGHDARPVDVFALQTINRLLKIYGLSEDGDSEETQLTRNNRLSTNALLWPSDLANNLSVLSKLNVGNREVPKLLFPSDDQELTKCSMSPPSNQSMETSGNVSADEDSSSHHHHPGLLVNSLKQHLSFESDLGFSQSLPKRLKLKQYLPDYTKYAKRFNSFEECNSSSCQERGYKEHYHCTSCTSRVCLKKEEMIRHFKWHKKREDSLQHGFMRYSPTDDCSKRFSVRCNHNGKHTHYHCLQSGCSKVYISTSDVQMHANYHRKDSAIIQEGFQRFRATENCTTPSCIFTGQKTTHFHCRRPGCSFTFKNKADMEKHKTYHQKDEILTRDGFKKFMKYEQCHFVGCQYSCISNHIHCIRQGCNYVLHSTSQLYSHKRRHERRELEQSVYKQLGPSSSLIAMDAVVVVSSPPAPALSLESLSSGAPMTVLGQSSVVPPSSTVVKREPCVGAGENAVKTSDSTTGDVSESTGTEQMTHDGLKVAAVKREFLKEKEQNQECFISPELVKLASDLGGKDLKRSLNLPFAFAPLPEENGKSDEEEEEEEEESEEAAALKFTSSVFFRPKVLPPVNEKKEKDESWKRYLTRYTANDPCHAQCQFLYKDHYHCNQMDCGWLFRSKDGVREHAKFHEQQDRITALTFMKYEAETKCTEGCEHSEKLLHFHCLWTNCSHVISSKDSVFSRLEHYKFHDNSGRRMTSLGGCNSGFDNQKRRRGRPPKFPKNEIPVIPKTEMTEDEIRRRAEASGSDSPIANGFERYEVDRSCPDDRCVYAGSDHFHCVRPRCHHATDRTDGLALHAKDFHSFIVIAEGFEFFDRNVSCRRPHCHSNQSNRHFHCIRPNCDYSFVRYSTMLQHDQKHHSASRSSVRSFCAESSDSNCNKRSLMTSVSPVSSTTKAATVVGGRVPATLLSSVSSLASSSSSASESAAVILSSASVALTPVLLASLQSLPGFSGQTVAPVILGGPIKQGRPEDRDLQLTSAPLKLVSIAPKPSSAIVTFQAPVSLNGVEIVSSGGVAAGTVVPSEAPLTVLLQQKTSSVLPVDWVSMKLKMHHRIHQNCGRPFCKLKKKEHYHCFDCNQAFSDPARLKLHVARHGFALDGTRVTRGGSQATNGELKPVQKREENADEVDSNIGDDSGHRPSEEIALDDVVTEKPDETQMVVAKNLDDCNGLNDADVGRLVIDLSSVPSDGSSVPEGEGSAYVGSSLFVDSNSSSSMKFVRKREFGNEASEADEPKKPKMASGGGYEKFRFTEDCGQDRCAYRLSMTHYHCSRPDCGYSFCDHSRFLQHSDRHQRIDVVMGDRFQHFHSKTDCRRVGCEYARSATHFHCVVCSYVCTDSSKVVAHRKFHSKMERIAENGFRKVGVGEDCDFATCVHRFKQTHYHCSHPNCGHVVMGPAQMGIHKAKHTNDTKAASNNITG